jgi:hypothetical protein
MPFRIIIGTCLFPPVNAVGFAVGCRNDDIDPPVSVNVGRIEPVGIFVGYRSNDVPVP